MGHGVEMSEKEKAAMALELVNRASCKGDEAPAVVIVQQWLRGIIREAEVCQQADSSSDTSPAE